jgi:hypothetical protein
VTIPELDSDGAFGRARYVGTYLSRGAHGAAARGAAAGAGGAGGGTVAAPPVMRCVLTIREPPSEVAGPGRQ